MNMGAAARIETCEDSEGGQPSMRKQPSQNSGSVGHGQP